MRVVGGEARGRKFLAPDVDTVRPTSDRVREAMFDVLASLGGLAEVQVLDLFAGSGALGIESLSRGAASVTFVDQDLIATKTIKQNIVGVKLEGVGETKIVQSEAIAYCRTLPSEVGGRIDVTFCDPPYSFLSWSKLLAVIPGHLLVLESAKPVELPAHLDLYRSYKYGGTLVTVVNRNEVISQGTTMSANEEVQS
jgi:16S rRNA (guanine966-N2)-methyltransferase